MLWACEKEKFPSFWKSSNEFKEYQSWFENQYSEIWEFSILQKSQARNDNPTLLIKPEWTQTSELKSENKSHYEFIEIPLKTNGLVTTKRQGSPIEVGVTKLVIRNNPKSGQKGGYLVTFIGDERYLDNHFEDLWKISFDDIPANFSGMILIHDIKGRFVSGKKIGSRNRIIGDISIQDGPKILTRSPCIYTITVEYYYGNDYGLTVQGEAGGQTYTYGKVVDDGVTIETGTFTINTCNNNNPDFDPVDPWIWGMGNLASATPTPNPCDGHNVIDGPLEIAPTLTIKPETSGIYGCVRTQQGKDCSRCGGNTPNHNKCHHGFDIKASPGSNVYSIQNGKIVFSGYISGYGNTVTIESNVAGNMIYLFYAHLQSYSVYPDDIVARNLR